VTEELSEAFEWAQSDTLWAADVQETTDGRFRMYYNACEGSSPRSAMGTAIAPTVEGPYEDEGIFLRSGMWDEPSEDGQIYDALIHPNVVDPHAFVDHRGKHRLVYGSYSGGIFLLDLDPKTGQPREGQGYGIHLIGGNHSRIEAPYMLYSRESGYYYLLVTFGGLDSFGGYNVRVGRSRSPVGPFLDKEGYDLRECTSDPDLPLFDDASIEPYGAKLMGGHQWTFGDEDPVGYTSPGHVSAWNDSERGGAFLVFHTRFPGQGELHQVRVHRLHVTKDGWPVLSPFRYGGEGPAGSRDTEVPRRALCGDWQVIDHGHDINVDPKQSQAIVLAANGRVSGALSGRWSSQGRHFVRLDLEGERFDGVVTRCWNPVTETWAPAISALGPDGRALWAVQE
jgi:arabinan endo-1,5-alpha-L-arabinosidase